MSEKPLPNPANDGPAEPAAAQPQHLILGGPAALGANTDNSPTIISKTPPTQSFVNFPGSQSSIGSIRGRTLAHFELLEPIGVGGMAAVLRARDKLLDRFVALKILPPEMAADPEHVKRFHQEARAAAKLDHENIARVYYCGQDQNLHFIAFEFVEGQNLRTLLERCRQIPVRDAVHYLLQIATGLAHAAARGVVHRDIKPSNIIIMPTGRVKLVDMGLARSLAPHDNRQLTQSGVTLGTFDYISPEQALEPRDADVRSDIYSLGCTFYHMLTGQPPVPEGTAAKKLHHHQHVAPIDPRQLNPEIPDEVAAILQRMLAKDAKDRYQRAEHLVQHVIQAAQKLGGAEVPEGVFFVDAPLPGPPRRKPLVLASIAVAVLAAFVLAVAVTTPRAPIVPLQRPKIAQANNRIDQPSKGSGPSVPKEPSAATATRKVSTPKELAEAFAEGGQLKLMVKDDLRIGETGLTYSGGPSGKGSLIVESEDPKKPQTLQFDYTPETENPKLVWAGLKIAGGTVTFKNLQFLLEAGHTPGQLVAGVAVTAGQVVFDQCTFTQQSLPEDGLIARRNVVPVASVAALNIGLQRAPLVFNHCWFASGQAAVSIRGTAKVEQHDCAFGPHACLFHLGGQDKDDTAEVFLSHVSAHVVQGPVFRLDDNVSCALAVQYSIFACPSNATSLDRPDLIRQTGSTLRAVKYEGKRNAYYQLMSFWAWPAAEPKDEVEGVDWSGFKKRIAASGGSDVGSSILKVSPWAKPTLGSENDPKVTFLIDPKQPDLRQENDKKNRPIGVESCVWDPLYPTGLQPLEQPVAASPVKPGPRERLVDPSGTITGERVYKKIEAAISEAEQDDVVLIKYNGDLAIEPMALTESRRIKLKPFPDCQPVLVLGETPEKVAALFHLHHSQIDFEHLEFALRPQYKHRSLALVSMSGDSICRFDQCVVTLDNTDNLGVDLEVVTLLDTRDAVKTAASEPKARAEVRFKECFVRGRGDLVSVQASRPLNLDLDNSLVCLAGSLLNVHSQGDEVVSADARTDARFHKLTSYLSEPALHLASGKMGRGLVMTHVEATHCLFAVAAAKPVVRLDGPENDNQLKKVLGWNGSANAFAGFDKLLEQAGSDVGAPLVYQTEDWKRFTTAAADTRFRAALQVAPGADRDFTQLLPSHFSLRSADLSPYGAAVESLPKPAAELTGQNRGG